MVVACLALLVALGGTGYAAIKLPANSVGTAQRRSNAVTTAKVKNGSLLSPDFKSGQIPVGSPGAQGPQGAKGDTGPAGPVDTSKLLGRTITVVISDTAGPGSFGVARATCPRDYEATGGGVDVNNVISMYVTSSEPIIDSNRTIQTPTDSTPQQPPGRGLRTTRRASPSCSRSLQSARRSARRSIHGTGWEQTDRPKAVPNPFSCGWPGHAYRHRGRYQPMSTFSFTDLTDIDPSGPGGMVRFVRRELGATAFGINHFTLPLGAAGVEHDHADSGQEEVMLILSGSGTLRVDGEQLELKPGRLVRLDPEATRVAIAEADGLTFITIGSPRDEPYAPRGPF